MKKLYIYFYCLTITASLSCMQKQAPTDPQEADRQKFEEIKRRFQQINTRPIQTKTVIQQNEELQKLHTEIQTLTYPSQEERVLWAKNIQDSITTNQLYQQHLVQREGRTVLNMLAYQKAMKEAGLLQSFEDSQQ